jgi:hypothetical protein
MVGRSAWLLGAGASQSAGLPTATDIIWDLKRRFYCSEDQQAISASDLQNNARVVLQFLASGLEGAVVKHVLDHVINSPTVRRIQSAGCLAGLFTFCSGINCIQVKELTDTAHGNK